MTERVGVDFTGSAVGAVGAARQTATAIRTVRTEANGLSPSLRTVERDTGKMTRGVIAGSGALAGLGKSIAYSSGLFLGGAGLIAGIKGAIDQAETLEKAEDSLGVVIRRNNGDVAAAIPLIRKWAAGQQQFGVSSAEATQGLARAAAITGSVQAAMTAYDEALVISKATGKDFNAVLIAASKAQEGQTTALARYIGTLPKGTTAQQLYNLVMAKYRGLAESNTTASDKLHASISNIEAKLGQGLLPVVQKYETRLDSWLSKSKNQQRITDDVSTAVRGLGGVLGGVADVIRAVDKATGGFDHTLELLLGLKVASVLTGWAGALRMFIGGEAALTGVEGANAATGTLLKRLTLLRTLASKPFQILIAYEIVKRLTGSAADLSQGTASDSTITVGGKRYVIGSGEAWTALIRAGWTPPKGVNVRNVTAQQEIGAARSLGGSGHIPGASDGTVPSTTAGMGIVGTAKWAARQPGAATSYKFGGIPGIGKGTHTDCSGFTQAVYKQNGITIPRTSQAQYASAKQHPSRGELHPGDLVFFNYEGPHSHVGIYIGGGMMIGDQHTGSGIVTVPMDWAHYDGAGSYSKMPRSHKGGGSGSPFGTPPPPTRGPTTAKAAPGLPPKIQLAISTADAAAAAAALTKGKGDDRKALAEQRAAIEEEIAWLRKILKTNIGTKARITYEDLLTGALGDLANLKTTSKTKTAGAGVGVIESLRNTIAADLRDLPAQLTPAEQVAVNHLKQLKKKLVPGLDPKDLADVRAGISRWGRALRNAVKDESTKAAQAAQAAAEAAARLWERGWQNAASTVLRNFQEQVVQPQLDAFDRETQRGLAALQAKYGAQTPQEKALADFQARRAAGEEAKQKADLLKQIADTEAQLAALSQGGGTGGTLIDIATGARTGIPADGSDPASQQQQLQQQLLDLQDQYNQMQLDDQEAALQRAADQSRAAADKKLADAEDAYQDQRDKQRQALQDMLDDQQTALQQSLDDWEAAIEAKKKSWLDFLKWLAAHGYSSAGVVNPGGATGGSGAGAKAGGGLGVPPPHIGGRTPFASGGKVPGRYVGRDTVPALLSPGEYVIDRRLSAALELFLRSAAGGEGVLGGVGDVYMDSYKVGRTVARPVSDAQRRQISYTLQRG